jgi:hypothetical protein
MPALNSVRDERFAQYVASGVSQSEAYRRVSGKTANANNHGDEFMAKRGMRERLAEIRAENAAKCEMIKEEYSSYLIRAMRTPAAEMDPHHEFCQHYKETGPDGVTREWRMPDKLRAALLLAQHCGWEAPTKINFETGDNLSAFLRRVISQGPADQT